MTDRKLVLVTGATGQQGGSVARALLAKGHQVRGMTRNPASPSAEALAAHGADMVVGNFGDPDSVARAAEGVDAMFGMGTPFEAGERAEVAQGIAMVDAAVAAGVPHFIYTSVASADQNTGIPHFDSKWEVEQHLATTNLTWSVIAPVYFMENLFFPQVLDGLRNGVYAIAMPGGVALEQIAVDNIGGVGTMMVERRDDFAGVRLDIAGDSLSADQAAAVLSDLLGTPVSSMEVPIADIRAMSEDLALMYEWFVEVGYSNDIEGLRQSYPEVGWLRFAEWAAAKVPQAL